MSKEGKLSNQELGKILEKLPKFRNDILIGPSIGEDVAAFAVDGEAIVLTSDPITAADEHHGRLAVDVCINDLASSGCAAVCMLLTVLAPVGSSDEDIESVIMEAGARAAEFGVEIIGGHTERTSSVNRIVVSAVAVGRVAASMLKRTGGAKPQDLLYMTKYAGIEGTFLLVDDESLRSKIGSFISVKRDGEIASGCGVSAMHDITEGGVLGAIHEMCTASGVGSRIDIASIPMLSITAEKCSELGIDPLRLIGSGSMLIAVAPENSAALEAAFEGSGIRLTRIGVCTEETAILGIESGEAVEIQPPNSDEIYRAKSLDLCASLSNNTSKIRLGDDKKFVIASNNKHKISEIKAMVAPYGIDVISMADAGIYDDIVEDGLTFEENSAIKADYIFEKYGFQAIADDSGLMVDALGGEPGVRSARYAGEEKSDEANNLLLLKKLRDLEADSAAERTARFVSVITLVFRDRCGKKVKRSFRGEVLGVIGRIPRGEGGFGYDPLFELPCGNTMAELSPEEKNRISHRADAMNQLISALK